MDARVDVPGRTAPIETIRIDGLAGPFLWVNMANAGLLSLAVTIPLGIISKALRGQLDSSTIGWSLILIFPGWIAWKNVNVVNSLNQKYTIRSLLMVGVPGIALGLVMLPLVLPFIREWLEPQKDVYHFLRPPLYLLGGSLALLATLAVWRLRRRVINPLGVKLIDLLSTLSQERTPGRLRNVGPERPLAGCLLIAAAVILIVGGDFLPAALMSYARTIGFFFLVMAIPTFQPSANTVLKADNRKPVLLMRSFIDDERPELLKSSLSSFFDPSLESRLTSHFAHYGPFIAVGAPSERIPVIGASRIRLFDYEWQDQVIRWIDGSVVILMMAGITDWVQWEMKQVIEHNAIGRLIICFPPVKKRKWSEKSLRKFSVNMQARLDRLQRAFAETRWGAALLQLEDPKSLRSLVFGEDGGVTVIRARSRSRNAYHLAILVSQWVNRAGRPDSAAGAGEATPASQGRRFWIGCGIAAALFGYGYGALILCTTGMYNLGLLYMNGQGLVKDYGKAREWFQKAADAGNALAMNNVGALYEKGQGVAQDYGKAREQYQKAADADNPLAMNNLGALYVNGQGVAQDYGKAREWFQKAADAGNALAMNNLGVLYLRGLGVAQDYGKASEWFQKAADAGISAAAYTLGTLYQTGQGVAQDYGKANEWLQKAVNAGNTNAMYNLGLLYIHGQGVVKDYGKASQLFQKAADADIPNAMNNLGVLYLRGLGVAQDYGKASEWFQKAADAGISAAAYTLGVLYMHGLGVAQDYGKANEWLQKAADAGDMDAMNALGVLYQNGNGVAKDYGKAREWYQKAAYAGSPVAMYNLGVLYQNGKGVAQDQSKAHEWLQKAADLGEEDAKQALSRLR
jgi:TPR repeat protein